MHRLALALLALVVASACDESARESTNDYYRNRQAKEVINAIVDAHGGEARLRELERVSARWTMTPAGDAGAVEVTLYQTRDSVRRDTSGPEGRFSVAKTPTDDWMLVDGKTERVTTEVHDRLQRDIDAGILQQQLVNRLLDFKRSVVFLGKKRLNDKDYFVIATRDPGHSAIEHYYSADDYLKEVELSRTAAGNRRITLFKSYRRFGDIVYPEEIETREDNGEGGVDVTSTMRLLELRDDFDDSVFARPAPEAAAAEPGEPAADGDATPATTTE